ncbi:GtrA family protein [Allochromatium vinosum]|uniref:GtrA family protein n=1 Tax=Allochromatium vinosum TaxID=1049 RepID=UPI0019089BAF|nr:GtrA family protein [Allochromatium vinosum]MBK1656435.1 polysaccharide synthesis protein GtrA [Allochromatium vinosum]
MISARTARQFLRYALVGLGSNLSLYLAYLALTYLGVGPKLAMSLLYLVGIAQTFVFNRSWSFGHQGAMHGALIRYVASYAFGYVLNLSVLWLAVDQLDYPHQIVQGVMIAVVATLIFLLQKFWVFPTPAVGSRSA